MTNTIRVEIRTTDPRIGTPGRDGRVVVEATETRRWTVGATGTRMVSFTMSQLPSDWPVVYGVAPVAWLVTS